MKKIILLIMGMVFLTAHSVWAELNENVLKQNIAKRITLIQQRRSPDTTVPYSPDKIKIVKKIKIQIGQYELYAVKLLLQSDRKGMKPETLTLLVDKSGKISFSNVHDIASGTSLVENAMDEISRVKLPANFGETFFTGTGEHEVVFISDPFCPFCRKAFQFLLVHKKQIRKWKLVHMPLSYHPGAVVAALVMEYAYEHKIKFQEIVKFAYTELSLPDENDKEAAEEKVFQQFQTRFPSLKFRDLKTAIASLKQRYGEKLKFNLILASKLGVQGTPTIFIDGIKVQGFKPFRLEKLLLKRN